MHLSVSIYLDRWADIERQLGGIPDGHKGVGTIEKNKTDKEDKMSQVGFKSCNGKQGGLGKLH